MKVSNILVINVHTLPEAKVLNLEGMIYPCELVTDCLLTHINNS